MNSRVLEKHPSYWAVIIDSALIHHSPTTLASDELRWCVNMCKRWRRAWGCCWCYRCVCYRYELVFFKAFCVQFYTHVMFNDCFLSTRIAIITQQLLVFRMRHCCSEIIVDAWKKFCILSLADVTLFLCHTDGTGQWKKRSDWHTRAVPTSDWRCTRPARLNQSKCLVA